MTTKILGKTMNWNGWQYYRTERGYLKVRHNPEFKTAKPKFVEKIKIASEEFGDVAEKYVNIFGRN